MDAQFAVLYSQDHSRVLREPEFAPQLEGDQHSSGSIDPGRDCHTSILEENGNCPIIAIPLTFAIRCGGWSIREQSQPWPVRQDQPPVLDADAAKRIVRDQQIPVQIGVIDQW